MAQTPYGFRFSGNQSMQDGSFEPAETALISRLLEKHDVFVDVGANFGFYTCLAASLHKTAVAIEPLPDNVRFICENLQENGWTAEIWPVGLSDRPGFASLYGGSTGASLLQGWAGVTDAWKRPVPLNALDNIVGARFENQRLLIKMDIEGAEFSALHGAHKTFERRPTWIVEITLNTHRAATNPNFRQTFEMFWARGYSCISVEHNLPVSRENVEEWARSGSIPDRYWNWLFIPNDSSSPQ